LLMLLALPKAASHCYALVSLPLITP